MRVDTSLLDGIAAVNTAAKTSSLKSTGTTTSFSSALKSAEEKETTKPVPGQNYAEILTGPRAGMYLNTSGNGRDGEAFILVKHNGREDHIYGTGENRKVISSGGDSKSSKSTDATDTKSSSGKSVSTDKASADERTKPMDGRAYADILNGSRSGMYLNTSGNVRDGQAFVLVNRGGREYHIYGTGKDRTIVSLKPPAEKADETPKTSTETPTTTSETPTGNVPTGSLVTNNPS
jgi:hypothetical protein